MRYIWLIVLSVIVLFGAISAGVNKIAQAENHNQPVHAVEVRDDIKAGTVLDVQRAIHRAEQAEASHLIIKLDTPGGLLQSTRLIVEAMQASTVPVVVYVDQPSGWAFSAGTIILLAADAAVAHPTASIGAAQPFSPGADDEVQDEKTLQATVSWIRGLADEHDRNPDIAEDFVTENLTLRGEEAANVGVIDAAIADEAALLSYLGAEDATVETTEPSVTARVLNILSDPFLVSLFLTLGSLAILLAIRSGEFEVSGAIGIVLLLIGLWGIGVVEFTVLGIGLLVVGAILVMVEVFDQPGFGIFGVAGLVSIIGGIFTLSEEPFHDQELMSVTGVITLITLLLGVVALAVISRALVKSIKSQPVSGAEGMIGEEAVVTTPLSPRGRVRFNGESWQAELSDKRTKAPKGAKTCIIGVKGNTLLVTKQSKNKGEK